MILFQSQHKFCILNGDSVICHKCGWSIDIDIYHEWKLDERCCIYTDEEYRNKELVKDILL